MKKVINQYLFLLSMLISINLMSSCEDTMLNNMVDDHVYLLNPGINEAQVFNFEKAIAEVIVVKSGVGQRASKLKLEVVPALLTQYNQANSTAYKELPASVYSLSNSSLDLPTDSYKASFDFVIDVQKFNAEQAKNPDATFVIPCEVTNLNPGMEDSVKMQSFMIPRIVEPYISFTKAGFLTDIINITSKSQDKVYLDNKIEINFPATGDVNYTIQIAKNSAQLINQYNTENGTSYVQLPAEALDLQANGKILKGVNYADYTYQVLKTKLVDAGNKPKYGKYLLPLAIEQVSQGKVHPSNSVVLIPFNYHE